MTNLSASQYRRLANKVSNQRRLVPGYETQLMRRLAPRTRGTQLTPHPGPYFPIGKPFGLSPSILQLRTILRATFPQLYEIHQCRILAYLYTLWSPPRSNTQRRGSCEGRNQHGSSNALLQNGSYLDEGPTIMSVRVKTQTKIKSHLKNSISSCRFRTTHYLFPVRSRELPIGNLQPSPSVNRSFNRCIGVRQGRAIGIECSLFDRGECVGSNVPGSQ